MIEPTKELIDKFKEVLAKKELHELHDKIDIFAQKNDHIRQFINIEQLLHNGDTFSLAGNVLTIGIALGMFLYEEAQKETPVC